MIQLRILSGKMAGETVFARRFPFNVGRSPENDLCLEEDGVWDYHLAIGFDEAEGFLMGTAPDALTSVNGQLQPSARLQNGDVISFGSTKIQFWLAPAKQHGLRSLEIFIWLLLAGVTLAQIVMLLKLRH